MPRHRRGPGRSIWDMQGQIFPDLTNAFREAFGESLGRPGRESADEWAPPVDFSETQEGFTVRADVPGIPRDAIDVTTEDDALIIRGESISPEPHSDETVHRRERRRGRFRRALALPVSADLSRVSARLSDGVLEVTIPKSQSAKPRRIEISG